MFLQAQHAQVLSIAAGGGHDHAVFPRWVGHGRDGRERSGSRQEAFLSLRGGRSSSMPQWLMAMTRSQPFSSLRKRGIDSWQPRHSPSGSGPSSCSSRRTPRLPGQTDPPCSLLPGGWRSFWLRSWHRPTRHQKHLVLRSLEADISWYKKSSSSWHSMLMNILDTNSTRLVVVDPCLLGFQALARSFRRPDRPRQITLVASCEICHSVRRKSPATFNAYRPRWSSWE